MCSVEKGILEIMFVSSFVWYHCVTESCVVVGVGGGVCVCWYYYLFDYTLLVSYLFIHQGFFHA